ncbi:MAG: carboxypeptidase regulatory-like domain-containing protein [Candidatus Cyclobacteriaceae bacterium M3_2C_046]
MVKSYWYLTSLFLLSFALLRAQPVTNTIRGKVFDQVTHTPVANANLALYPSDPMIGISTDSSGQFSLNQVPVGRYDIRISHIAYKPQLLEGVLVESGKELVLQIPVEESINILPDLDISSRRLTLEKMKPLSSFNFSVEKSQRYAATFYDPARLVSSNAGVATSFDQANNIIVRGNSPNGVNWQIEGADVVNPNHLTNAGTFSDRASLSGGGVSILSAQTLAGSNFYSGAYAPGIGNALSGVFDIHMRQGNDQHREYTLQAGLLGIDLSAEGPFNPGQSTYLVNYRYSTIGLISALGVDLGDEAINFQDLSFSLDFKTDKLGDFKLFGLGGLSQENFESPRDSSLWDTQEDRYDVNFSTDMGALGLNHQLTLHSDLFLNNVVLFSGLINRRVGRFIEEDYQETELENDFIQRNMVSYLSTLHYKLGAGHRLRVGWRLNHILHRQSSALSTDPDQPMMLEVSTDQSYQIIQPFLDWQGQLNRQMSYSLGMHVNYLHLNQTYSLEPRIKLNYVLNPNHGFSLAYGKHSMSQTPGTYFSTFNSGGQVSLLNLNLELTKAHHFIVGHQWLLPHQLNLQTELYWQSLYDVPIVDCPERSFSTLNLMEEFVDDPLVNKGRGRNFGVEWSLERKMENGFYFLLNNTIFDSEYLAGDRRWRDTRFNSHFISALTTGKEFRSAPQKLLGINLRMIYQGGFNVSPIDFEASQAQNRTVFIESKAFEGQLPNYYRIDLNFNFKKYKKNYTRTLSIDIQNLTSRKNVAFQYYDIHQEKVITKYQLGIIPFLSYRVEFN